MNSQWQVISERRGGKQLAAPASPLRSRSMLAAWPLVALLVAAGAGAVLGWLVKR